MSNYKKHLLSKGSKIRDALRQLDVLAKDAIIFVVDEQNGLIGSLTDGDVRRGLLKEFTIDDPVEEIIQKKPKYILEGERDISKIIEFRENNYRVIPVVNERNQIVNVINFSKVRSYLPIDAVLMAGGRGERLKPLTNTTPKPLLMVGEKPILEHHIDRLRLFGINDFWITLKYLGEQIESYFGSGTDNGINIKYHYEEFPMGTIGSVSSIKKFGHDYILIANSDVLTDLNYEEFFLDFLAKDADFSVVTIPYNVDIPYAVLETSNGHVINLREKPTYTFYSNAGIYLLKRKVLDHIPVEKYYNATDLMEILIKMEKKLISYPYDGYWLDIGRHEDFEKANIDINHIRLQ